MDRGGRRVRILFNDVLVSFRLLPLSSLAPAQSQPNCPAQAHVRDISQRPSNSNPVMQKLHALDIKALCQSMKRWLAETYVAACHYRDWSYEVVGINKTYMVPSDPRAQFVLGP